MFALTLCAKEKVQPAVLFRPGLKPHRALGLDTNKKLTQSVGWQKKGRKVQRVKAGMCAAKTVCLCVCVWVYVGWQPTTACTTSLPAPEPP